MKFKILAAIVIGTALEYFDFLLFAHFSLILAPLFFPSSDPIASSILSLGLFALGFLMRPIGGLIFGSIGDYCGRKSSLSASFIWIALPTLGMCLMPTYEQIGLLAPCGLVLCRIGQGLSLGGEYNNAGIFLMEHARSGHRGFYSGILAASGTFGSIAALGCAYLVVQSDLQEYLWRVPFFFGACMAVLGYKLRRVLRETPEFKAFAGKIGYQHFAESRCWKDILADKKNFLIVIAIGAMTGVLVWIPSTYTHYYLTQVAGWSTTESVPMTLVALVLYIITLLIMGQVADKIGFRKVMACGALLTLLSAYPLFHLLTTGHPLYAQIGFALLAGTFGSAIHAIMVDLYPVSQRCRAISVGFSLGISIGGASPMIAAWLVSNTGLPTAPSFYMMAAALFGMWAVLSCRPFEIKPRKLVFTLARVKSN